MSQLSLEKFSENLPVSGVVAASQVAIGLGAGLLAADRMNRSARQATGIVLVGLGVAAIVPLVAGIVTAISNRPHSTRSMAKRLESIRHDSGLAHDESAY